MKENTKGGAITEEGKDVSKMNATKHGIFNVNVSQYEQEYYEHLLNGLIEEFEPIGTMENLAIQTMCKWLVRSYRVNKAENEFMTAIFNPAKFKLVRQGLRIEHLDEDKYEVVKEAYKPLITEENIESISNKFLKYDTGIENRYYKALHELQRLQAIRKGDISSVPKAVDITMDNGSKEEFVL